ncbi:MAG TPA: MaoC family dehydratase [Candidatus Baltobacteraceae bacterium]|nr:MaoC family dehydratase [Candidatus Baltobacteraceae bacterium]
MSDAKRYYEDFEVGDVRETGRYRISEEEGLAFARAYDPQSFHLDAKAAESSFFKKLVISGWQTAAISMRLLVDARKGQESPIIGTGIDELRWTFPVAPGDELHVRSEVIEKAPWPGGKRRGIIRFRNETINQDDVVVMTYIANAVAPMRD